MEIQYVNWEFLPQLLLLEKWNIIITMGVHNTAHAKLIILYFKAIISLKEQANKDNIISSKDKSDVLEFLSYNYTLNETLTRD